MAIRKRPSWPERMLTLNGAPEGMQLAYKEAMKVIIASASQGDSAAAGSAAPDPQPTQSRIARPVHVQGPWWAGNLNGFQNPMMPGSSMLPPGMQFPGMFPFGQPFMNPMMPFMQFPGMQFPGMQPPGMQPLSVGIQPSGMQLPGMHMQAGLQMQAGLACPPDRAADVEIYSDDEESPAEAPPPPQKRSRAPGLDSPRPPASLTPASLTPRPPVTPPPASLNVNAAPKKLPQTVRPTGKQQCTAKQQAKPMVLPRPLKEAPQAMLTTPFPFAKVKVHPHSASAVEHIKNKNIKLNWLLRTHK